MNFFKLAGVLLLGVAAAACGGEDGGSGPGVMGQGGFGASGGAGTGGASGAGVGGLGTGGAGVGGASGAGVGGAGVGGAGVGGTGPGCGPVDTTSLCSQPAQGPGAPPPPPANGCPAVQSWNSAERNYNRLASGREFIFLWPNNTCPDERVPLVFMWHWIGGEADDWLMGDGLQQLADRFRVAFVAPVAIGAMVFGQLDTRWPFDATQTVARMDEEFRFFDDMLGCVASQYNINIDCVGSLGVSAGALFNSQLLQIRGHHLSAVAVMSGGVGELVHGWVGSQHKMPAIVLWGGPMDSFGGFFNFDPISKNLVNGLASNGHFLIECEHTCGHVPPILPIGNVNDPNADPFAAMAPFFQFFKDHPYWLPDGASPFLQTGLPNFPGFCGIGPGSGNPAATPACPI